MFDFIHIGMGKCLSTSLQTLWARSDNYNYASGSQIQIAVEKIIKEVNDAEIINKLRRLQFSLSSDDGLHDQEKPSILSCEGFTFTLFENPSLDVYIPNKQQAISKELLAHTKNILIIIRDPLHWIKSAHSQMIKQGGCLSLRDMSEKRHDAITGNLNLSYILDIWSQNGAKITVLPMEIFSENREEFWNIYESHLNVARPTKNGAVQNAHSNVSNYNTLKTHQSLNALLKEIERRFHAVEFPEKEMCLKATNILRVWGTRRALETADGDDVEALNIYLNESYLQDYEHDKLDVNRELKQKISDHFISAIPDEDYISAFDIKNRYREALWKN